MTTYYVSTTGSDNGAGSATSPWATINHALEANLQPGDTIMVAPGTYNEAVSINKGGSAAGNVTIESEVAGAAIIKAPAGSFNAVYINANYVTVEGFQVEGASGSGIFGMSVHHVSVLNNVVHDNAEGGISFVYSEFETIEGNTTYNNASSGWFSGISVYENRNISGDTTTTGYRTIIANNTSYDNVTKSGAHCDGNGIIVDDFQSSQNSAYPSYTYPTLVENNVVYGNGGKGIQIYHSDYVTVSNNTAYNNNQDTANTGTWRGEISNSDSNHTTFINNIAVANTAVNASNTAISNTSDTGSANTNVTWSDNITYNGTTGAASVNNDGGNSVPTAANGNQLGVNPKFVNAGVDFHLQSNSPAVSAGANGATIGAEGVSGTTSTAASTTTSTAASTTTSGVSTESAAVTATHASSTDSASTTASSGTASTTASSGTSAVPVLANSSTGTASSTNTSSTGASTASASSGDNGTAPTSTSGDSSNTGHTTTSVSHAAVSQSTSRSTWWHHSSESAASDTSSYTSALTTGHTLRNAHTVMNLLDADATASTNASAAQTLSARLHGFSHSTTSPDLTTVTDTASSLDLGNSHASSLIHHTFDHLWG